MKELLTVAALCGAIAAAAAAEPFALEVIFGLLAVGALVCAVLWLLLDDGKPSAP